MRWIRILDKEEAYAKTLGAYLEKRLEDCRVVVGEHATLAGGTGEYTVAAVVAGSGYRDWAGEAPPVPVLRLAPWTCLDGNGEDFSGVEGPGRLGSAREIADAIDRMTSPPGAVPAPAMCAGRDARVTGLVTDACDRVKKTHIDRLFATAIDAGGRGVYVPLLPAHRTACIPMADTAGTLTQLLLRAVGEDLGDTVLGGYLHPARSGVLCIRPAESHEHLLQCGADCLRRVTGLVVRWMERQPPSSLAIIDISDLPEDTSAAVLCQCDGLLLLSGGRDKGRYGFHDHIGPLMARLPARCRVAHIHTMPPCHAPDARGDKNRGEAEPA